MIVTQSSILYDMTNVVLVSKSLDYLNTLPTILKIGVYRVDIAIDIKFKILTSLIRINLLNVLSPKVYTTILI